MERLTLRLKILEKALLRLKEALDAMEKINKTDTLHAFIRDSTIKRFEFSVDIFWKTLKDVLEVHHKINTASPKTVAKESFSQKIISQDEFHILEDMIDCRNNTSHRYNEEMAEDTSEEIHHYYTFMNSIKDQLLILNKKI
jgi:nucleotidyltransferase substrate binding protein (TIGR01987 family)